MPDSTVIQVIHATIFRIDTLKDNVFIANAALNSVKGSNTQLWTTFIPVLAAIITSVGTLVLFVLTYRKDVKFNREKYISEQEKYKFEKAHLKKVEILENRYIRIRRIDQEISECFDLIDLCNTSEDLNNFSVLIEDSLKRNIKIFRFEIQNELYLSKELNELLNKIETELPVIAAKLLIEYEKNRKNFDKNTFVKHKEEFTEIHKLVGEFLNISWNSINDKVSA